MAGKSADEYLQEADTLDKRASRLARRKGAAHKHVRALRRAADNKRDYAVRRLRRRPGRRSGQGITVPFTGVR